MAPAAPSAPSCVPPGEVGAALAASEAGRRVGESGPPVLLLANAPVLLNKALMTPEGAREGVASASGLVLPLSPQLLPLPPLPLPPLLPLSPPLVLELVPLAEEGDGGAAEEGAVAAGEGTAASVGLKVWRELG